MENIFTYKSSLLSPGFSIFKQGMFVGTLDRPSWLNDTVAITCDGKDYTVQRKGRFRQKVFVTDRRQGNDVFTIVVTWPFFGLYSEARLNRTDGSVLRWKQTGFFKRRWHWVQNDDVVVRGTEDYYLVLSKGAVNLMNSNLHDSELLGLLGLYLRSSVYHQSVLFFSLGVALLLLQLLRWVYG